VLAGALGERGLVVEVLGDRELGGRRTRSGSTRDEDGGRRDDGRLRDE
jgi:hypothetical protein